MFGFRSLDTIHYAIRGPVLHAAESLEAQGLDIIKLNVGNPPSFGVEADFDVLESVREHLAEAQAYSNSKGLLRSRESVAKYYAENYGLEIHTDDIYIGNGVSELIALSLEVFLNPGDEVLLPSPDYPLWSARVSLCNGIPRYYRCALENDWVPTIESMAALITPKTKALVIISPNNPTGAVYPPSVLKQMIELAAQHDLLVFADEIYERIVFDGIRPHPAATLMEDTPCIFFNGLSKTYRCPGFRCGWLCVHDPKNDLTELKMGLEKVSSLRLCSNVIAQLAMPVALEKSVEIEAQVRPGGVYYERMKAAERVLDTISELSYMKPKGAIYIFPRISPDLGINNSESFVLDFLHEKHVLLVPGSGFNYTTEGYFRIVCLPEEKLITSALERLKDFLSHYSQRTS